MQVSLAGYGSEPWILSPASLETTCPDPYTSAALFLPSVLDALSALTQVAPQDSKFWSYENYPLGNRQPVALAHPNYLPVC